MINTPTVFVLGAGVSMPYGFPSGRLLLSQIYRATRPAALVSYVDPGGGNPTIAEIGGMLWEEFGETSVMEFGNELYLSQQTSVDAFLEHRPEFMKIGKTAIALCLARMENSDNLLSMDVREKGCYQYLFQKMNSDWDTFSENRVAFITFNYDRSLEEYFFTALRSTYGKSEEECASLVNQMHIVHVHGSLGPLPWQSAEGIPYNNKYISIPGYGDRFNAIYREQMRDNIIVISEGQDESPEFQKAFSLLNRDKNHIIFLGFGYHPINLQRLRLLNLPNESFPKVAVHGLTGEVFIYGTAMGLEGAEMEYVKSNWGIRLLDNTSDSLMFLRKYYVSYSSEDN